MTEIGLIKDILVPRCRKKGFKSKVFKRYQRRQENVNKGIQDMFIVGVSTRRVEEVLQPLLGMNVSAGAVSNIAKELNRSVEAFHKRTLSDDYSYLFLDGVYLSVKSALSAHKRPVFVAYGIKENGERELINFRLGKRESTREREVFLNDMYSRSPRIYQSSNRREVVKTISLMSKRWKDIVPMLLNVSRKTWMNYLTSWTFQKTIEKRCGLPT